MLAHGAYAAATGRPGVEALSDWLNGIESFAASFEQQRYDEYGALLETSKGEAFIRRPGRFRWAYTEPYAQTIVTDGQTLWIYDADLEQVTMNAVTEATAGSPAELLVDGADVGKRYDIEPLEDDGDYAWFRLTPKGEARDFRSIELGMAGEGVRAMRLTDNLGQRTVLVFGDIRADTPLADALFEFVPPEGVDVIEGAVP